MIFDNVSFQTWCCLIGAFNLLLGLAMVLLRGKAMTAALAFSRSAIAGMVLSTLAFLWAAVIVYVAPLDFLVRFKTIIVVLLVLSAPLSWFWMPDLLAARALGGIMVLLPAPVLLASRLVDSDLRLIMVVLMYLYAIAGMFLIMSPYHCRNYIKWLTDVPARFNSVGIITVILGGILITVAFAV